MEGTMSKWIAKNNTWIAPRPCKPGVWRRKEKGFLVRGRAKDPRTGKLVQVRFNVLDTDDPTVAYEKLQAELRAIRSGSQTQPLQKKRFAVFAPELFEERVKEGRIASASNRVKIASILERHLIPAFGERNIDEITHREIVEWRKSVADTVYDKTYSPVTANSWLVVMRIIFKAVTRRYELTRNPMDGIDNFDTRLVHTYTEEEPNALLAPEVPLYLAKMRELYPQHFAMVALGFATGWRPSTLRPLRRQGPQADVLWDQGIILVRRSHTEFKEIMDAPKTKKLQRVCVPPEIIEILKWHSDRLPDGKMKESELLFPDENGELLDRGCLRKPFLDVNKALKLKKTITPRAMRRTFQDLARAANVNDIVTRSISGHATEAMQQHYSTVNQDEQRAGLARVVSLAGFKQALEQSDPPASGGPHSGPHTPDNEKAG